NLHFVVERSADGRIFTPIATIAGKGNSSTMISYQAVDKSPLADVNYYQLKQVDRDGTFTYSNVVSVIMRLSGKSALELFPNPVNKSMKISLTNASGIYSGIVTGLSGQLYMQERGSISDLNQRINSKLDSLKPGMY